MSAEVKIPGVARDLMRSAVCPAEEDITNALTKVAGLLIAAEMRRQADECCAEDAHRLLIRAMQLDPQGLTRPKCTPKHSWTGGKVHLQDLSNSKPWPLCGVQGEYKFTEEATVTCRNCVHKEQPAYRSVESYCDQMSAYGDWLSQQGNGQTRP